MFAGIIEATAQTMACKIGDQSLELTLEKPKNFNDLSIGDSIACNGICLTLEKQTSSEMTFTLGFETLQLTGWDSEALKSQVWNLERSMRVGDRVHGHLVSGHVDGLTSIENIQIEGDCVLLRALIPDEARSFVWKKSSITLNGVSLTVNKLDDGQVEVCLVPETLRKTNLSELQVGSPITFEADYYMKGLIEAQKKGWSHALTT